MLLYLCMHRVYMKIIIVLRTFVHPWIKQERLLILQLLILLFYWLELCQNI
jgi:hypothetical protein